MGNCMAVTQMGVTQAGKDEAWVLFVLQMLFVLKL